MRRGKYLLLLLQLAEHLLLCGCENQKAVSMFPNIMNIYLGDLFFLKCPFQGEVTWYHNNTVQQSKNERLKIPVAARRHSGTYHCQGNSGVSNNISVNVHDLHPRASLILKTGHPVMQTGSSVILMLDTDEDLVGWSCFALREQGKREISLNIVKGSTSIEFQPNKLVDVETIFWCENKDQSQRSNQVVLRTSDKDVSMEMYFTPVMDGDSLNLKCVYWGSEKISHVRLYKDGNQFMNGSSLTHRIDSVAETDQGGYKCEAIITNKGTLVSDVQQLFVKEKVMRAVVSETVGLSCSCPGCSNIIRSMWYKINENSPPLKLPGISQGLMIPDEKGTYACIAVHDLGKTSISKGYLYNPGSTMVSWSEIIIGSLVFIILLGLVAGALIWKQKLRRSKTGPLYEDVMLKSKEDDRYERLRGAQEMEYDTLQPAESEHVKKEGDYQPLAKAAMTEGVYHTLGMEGEGSGGAVGGYETLQKKTIKGEIYHTIRIERAASEGQN